MLDPTKLIPEEVAPGPSRSAASCSTASVDNFFAETEQVAFCTQNIVPGVDFTNDPLLQGRNFSYLDTQLKRLGGPNFTHIPVNAPKCPMAHFQQDGHMAMTNPVGRVNYEPNSWTGDERGPREDPDRGLHHLPRRGGGRQAPAPARVLRRPLQPGVAVLPEPAARRAAAHHRRLHLRAVQGRAAGHPRADGGQPPQRRRGPRRRRSPTASAWPSCPPRPRPAVAARPRPRAVARAEHPRQRRPTPSPAASSACSSATARRPRWSRRCRRRVKAEGATVEVDRPDHRRRRPRRRHDAARPTRWSAAGRRCSTTPWPSSSRRGRRRRRSPACPPAKDFVTDAHAHHKFIAHTRGPPRSSRPPA